MRTGESSLNAVPHWPTVTEYGHWSSQDTVVKHSSELVINGSGFRNINRKMGTYLWHIPGNWWMSTKTWEREFIHELIQIEWLSARVICWFDFFQQPLVMDWIEPTPRKSAWVVNWIDSIPVEVTWIVDWIRVIPREIGEKITFSYPTPFDFNENWHTYRVLWQKHAHAFLAPFDLWG